nr:WRKY transcription factor [Rehmannia glutinosa]
MPPPSLPISPPPAAFSPSSYFSFPRGLSPPELFDSPVLLSASNILASPTTGTFPIQDFNWNNNSDRSQQKDIKNEQRKSLTSHGHQKWGYQESVNPDFASSDKSNLESEFNSRQSFSPEMATIHTNDRSNDDARSEHNQYNQSSQTLREENKKSDDGYNWRKYGQKQVKGSENPRSYYKCTYPNCLTKKKVERSLDGQITEIVIRGTHNHPKPQSSRRSSSSSSAASASSVVIQPNSTQSNENAEQSYRSNGTGNTDSFIALSENSLISNDSFEQSTQKRKSGGDELDEDHEHDAKRWKGESESEDISVMGSRTVREPRVVVQTMSNVDILDDGYRWRKYGQKVVKGNPNPRSYYKCTNQGCQVRKHVERASHDPRAVITTYEGKHNHDVPPARSSGNNSLSRTMPYSNNVAIQAVRPLPLPYNSAHPQIPEGSYQYSRF